MSHTHSVSRFYLIISLLVILVAGCGHVSGNYPVKETKPVLPAEFKSPRGQETTLVWVDEGRVHGFKSFWRDTGIRAEAFRKLAAGSGLDAHKDGVKMFQALSDEGTAEIQLFVFFARGVEVRCQTGDFLVRFTDGTTIPDSGILRYEPRDEAKPYRFTREGPLILSSEPVGKNNPLPVIVFLSAEHLDKRVESVSYVKPF